MKINYLPNSQLKEWHKVLNYEVNIFIINKLLVKFGYNGLHLMKALGISLNI
jgi:hypothetical protein